MRTPFLLLKCIGKALLNVVGGGIVGDLLIESLPEVAKETWDAWNKEKDREQQRIEMEAIVQAGVDQIREQVAEIKKAIVPNNSPEIELILEGYLTQVPAMVRKSLRRPSDPTGTTVSTDLVPKMPDELLAFLPPKLPRFKRGDRPLVGVDWELEELLGVGGFGEVWKARNPHMTSASPVALKFCLDATAAKVLRNEAAMLDRVMRQGKHFGIVQLQHTYLSSETPCLEYEFVEGGDLAGVIHEWHRSGCRPNPEQAAKVVLQLAEIVGFAHRLNPPIVHRDLKPANILVQRQEGDEIAPKVADFGIGGVAASQAIRQTNRGTSRGEFLATAVQGSYTPLYASPQQMRGEQPDPRDDVFALGVIWYQLLTGDLANGRPGGTRWHKRLTEQGVASEMVDLLETCFEDDPGDRPADAASLADSMKPLLKVHLVRPENPPKKEDPLPETEEQPRKSWGTEVYEWIVANRHKYLSTETTLEKPQPKVASEPQVAISKTITPPFAPEAIPVKPPISAKVRLLLRTLNEHPHSLLVDSFHSSVKVTDAEVIVLALLPEIASVKEIKINANCLREPDRPKIGDDSLKALATSPYLTGLTTLHVIWQPITDIGVAAVADCSHFASLTDLNLAATSIGAAGIKALATSPYLSSLRNLDISLTKIGDAGAMALADSSCLARLTILNLKDTGITALGASALAASPHLTNLTELVLGRNQIGDDGAMALAASPNLAKLNRLDLSGDKSIGDTGMDALLDSFGDRFVYK